MARRLQPVAPVATGPAGWRSPADAVRALEALPAFDLDRAEVAERGLYRAAARRVDLHPIYRAAVNYFRAARDSLPRDEFLTLMGRRRTADTDLVRLADFLSIVRRRAMRRHAARHPDQAMI